MEKKEYLAGVTIIEGRNLKGKDAGGTSDPFVKITVANLAPQVSMKKFQTNTVVWNQSFTFPGLMMNQYELETFELIIEVYDYNALMTNELIGYYSIGLSTLYRNLNHEFYRVWLTLFNPEFPNDVQGYLQVSCFLVGPGERPPAHAQDENVLDDEEEIDEEQMAGMNEEQKIQAKKKQQGLFLLSQPQIVRKGYQLSVNVLKAEGLPQCDSSGACNSFISVRSVGSVQVTRVVDENYNPIYNARLQYPVFLPILNDKVTMRIWSQNRRTADTFIANIPEYPSAFDFFNIAKLMSADGKMRATWFNLYGIHPLERGWFQTNNANKKEGSTFLGRVLISMLLSPNEKPQLVSTMANPVKEPQSMNFLLWVDAYDLVNCDEANGKPVYVVATIGNFSTAKHYAKYKEQTRTYTWQKISLKQIQVNYPLDPKQTPDIIINIYTEKTFSGEQRIGYIRIPVKDCQRKTANPQWYRLNSPYNDKTCPGIILMNIQYVWDNDIERFPKQRGVEGSYKIFAQIINGFEIAPQISAETLNTKIDIKIGNVALQKEGLFTKPAPGRYPQWNELLVKEIVLDKNLQFASDMRVILYNQSKSMVLRRDQDEVIGEFSVPVETIRKFYKKPQFFNVISNEGALQGQVMARFFLREIDQKKKNEDFSRIIDQMNSIKELGFTVNIEVALLGIRNLLLNAKRPTVTLRLTNDPGQRSHTIKLDSPVNTNNPDFGKVVKFEKVDLSVDPLLWPLLEVIVQDDGVAFGVGGCESCYTTICLFEFADFLSPKDILFAKTQLGKNQNKLSLVQKQINPIKYFNKKQRQASTKEEDSNESDDMDDDSDDDDDDDFGMNMAGGQRFKEVGNKFDSDSDDDDYDDDELNPNDIDIQIGAGGKRKKIRDDQMDDDDQMDGNERKKKKGKGGDSAVPGAFFDGTVIDVNNIIEIGCTPYDKEKEKKARQLKIEEIEKKIDRILLDIQQSQRKEKTEKLKMEMIGLKNLIQTLQEEEMNENKFWGYQLDDAQEEFQYGREVIKEGTMEKMLVMPYDQFPLFSNSWIGDKVLQVNGMLRGAKLTGAMIKAKIKVTEVEEEDSEEEDDDNEANKNKFGTTPGGPGDTSKPASKDNNAENPVAQNEEENEELALLTKIKERYPFDITKERFLKSLISIKGNFKIRVYILTCQNLTAIESYVDLKTRLAGLQALCSANPFPVIIVGDGINDTVKQKLKYVNDRDKQLNQDLNPKFYRSYEFDANFPDDWRLEIQIQDKGTLSYTDSLIGSTIIDLEDRLCGNFRRRTIDTLQIYKEMNQQEIRKEEKKDQADYKYLQELKQRNDDLIQQITKLNQIEEKPAPVEFRELRHPNKKQAQGMVEMWVEVLTQEEARRLPMARIMAQSKDEYELRLIVWETRDVPLVNGDSVDIFVRVCFDPSGWAGGLIEKQTDIHYASKDGRGVFNYRFLFDVETPCDFPRLKFQIFDYGFMTDEAIGESILNLKKTMSLLHKEGRIEIPKTWLSFYNPNTKSDECGQVLISMSIIPRSEAEQTPVGEAQNEPNRNPFLEKPLEGRGLADQFASVSGIDLGKLKLPQFNFMRNFIIIGVIFGIVVVVLIVIMFLKKNMEQTKGRAATQGKEEEKQKTIEQQLADLESDDSELEELRKRQKKSQFFNDKQWKIIVGAIGTGINVGLIYFTLQMIDQLLSGGSSS